MLPRRCRSDIIPLEEAASAVPAPVLSITRAVTLPHATDVTHEIAQVATTLLESSLPRGEIGIRLLGVGIRQFTGDERQQQFLFDDPAEQKHVQLDATLDQLHARFGTAALQRGSGLLHQAQHRAEPRPQSDPPRGPE